MRLSSGDSTNNFPCLDDVLET